MADDSQLTGKPGAPAALSLPGIPDAPSLLKIRVSPAQFARLHGVSRTTTSRWISSGLLQVGVDGKLDAAAATRIVLARDPARARARILKSAAVELTHAQAAAADARRELVAARAEIRRAHGEVRDLEVRLADAARQGREDRRRAESITGDVASARHEIERLQERIAVGDRFREQLGRQGDRLLELIIERRGQLRALDSAGDWSALLRDLSSEAWRHVIGAGRAEADQVHALGDLIAGGDA